MSARLVVNTLGYAGLIPFIVPAIMVTVDSGYTDIAILIAETYSFAIICFLTGSWWGMACGTGNRVVIVLSNVYFVTAFLLMVITPGWWSLAASVLLIGIFGLEQNRSLFPALEQYYRTMRAILTLFSSGSMMVIHLAR